MRKAGIERPPNSESEGEAESESEAEGEAESESESEGEAVERCGNGLCQGGETCETCSIDCSSRCTCDPGFQWNGSECVDINECAAGTDDCGEHAICDNQTGDFDCACESGFIGDGRTCTDVNECTESTDDCAEYATCTNVAGGFTCECANGFVGDGTDCFAEPIGFTERPTDARWATEVVSFSSQYSSGDNSAEQVQSAPDTCGCGDQPTAWTSAAADSGSQSITVGFGSAAASVYGVYVHETIGTGAIVRVEIASSESPTEAGFEDIFSGIAAPESCDRWVLYPFDARAIATVRVTLDTTAVSGWNEIDAIGLKTTTLDACDELDACPADATCAVHAWGRECTCGEGYVGGNPFCVAEAEPITLDWPPATADVQWASAVLGFSSQYAAGNFSADQATGLADVCSCGDSVDAWSPSAGDTAEWLSVAFSDPPDEVYGIYVHETYGSGAVVGIDVATTDAPDATCFGADWAPIWEGSASAAECPRWVLYPLPGVAVRAVRLRLNSATITGYSEIDAIALKTTP